MFVGCSGFMGLSITPMEILPSQALSPLFLLKNGNPFRGKSLVIRYDLERAWKTNIKKANTPTIKEGSRGVERPGNKTGINSIIFRLRKERIKEKIIQYLAFRTSLGCKTTPSERMICSLNLGESAESFEKGLRKALTIQEINDKITKEVKAKWRLKNPTPREIKRGVSQDTRIETLLGVQYAFVKRAIFILCHVPYYALYFTIRPCVSQVLSHLNLGGLHAGL